MQRRNVFIKRRTRGYGISLVDISIDKLIKHFIAKKTHISISIASLLRVNYIIFFENIDAYLTYI